MPGAIERSAIEENDLCLRVREEQQENGSGEPIERTGAKKKKRERALAATVARLIRMRQLRLSDDVQDETAKISDYRERSVVLQPKNRKVKRGLLAEIMES